MTCICFKLFLSARAVMHMTWRLKPSCPQLSGRRDGNRVRWIIWESTHFTRSRKSLIVFSNKEMLNWSLFENLAYCIKV